MPRMTVNLPDDLNDWIADRQRIGARLQGVPAGVTSELLLWRTVLTQELRRPLFDVDQLRCLAEVLRGSVCAPYQIGPILLGELVDAFHFAREDFSSADGSYSSPFGVDEKVLVALVASIGPAAELSLRVALQTWMEKGLTTDAAGFEEVGIRLARITAD